MGNVFGLVGSATLELGGASMVGLPLLVVRVPGAGAGLGGSGVLKIFRTKIADFVFKIADLIKNVILADLPRFLYTGQSKL